MHQGSPLLSVLYVFAAALVSATVLARLRQPNIIGYLIGGMLIGPFGLHLVPYENVELLAEIGIGLLMFTIGVELSITQLIRVRNVAVFGGSLIVVLLTLLCLALQGLFHWSWQEAIVWGLCTGLSSTVVVLKLLAERGEVGSTYGNVSTGILLFQDLISIPILVLLPLLAPHPGSTTGEELQQVLLILTRLAAFLAALYLVGRFLVPHLLRFVAHTHSKELFSISVLSITLAIAAITSKAGLSLALGAFLAGLIVSESDFGHQAATEVLPLKDSFSAVFFVSVGMLLDFHYFVQKWPVFTLGLAFVILLKFFIILGICFLFRYPNKISVFTALALAQISEFGFLVLVAAKKLGIFPEGSYQRLLGITILSIIMTPYLLKAFPRVKKWFAFMNKSRWVVRELEITKPDVEAGDEALMEKHVILCGYGPTGAIVAKRLQGVGLPLVVVDLNYKQIQALKASKQHAVYGDSSSTIVLEAAGLRNAAMLVVTIPDPQAMRALVRKVKKELPNLPIVVRVRYMSDRDSLVALGADDVVWEEQEAGEEIANRALRRLDIALG